MDTGIAQFGDEHRNLGRKRRFRARTGNAEIDRRRDLIEQAVVNVLARLEVVVQRGTAQLGDFGNGLNGGGMVATDGDHLARGAQDAGPGLSRISACRATLRRVAFTGRTSSCTMPRPRTGKGY